MHLIPKNDILIVKEPDRETQTKEGIVIPDIANRRDDEQVAQGELLADSGEYLQGDWVLFHKVLPIDAMIKDEEGEDIRVWFLKAEDVLAVLDK